MIIRYFSSIFSNYYINFEFFGCLVAISFLRLFMITLSFFFVLFFFRPILFTFLISVDDLKLALPTLNESCHQSTHLLYRQMSQAFLFSEFSGKIAYQYHYLLDASCLGLVPILVGGLLTFSIFIFFFVLF